MSSSSRSSLEKFSFTSSSTGSLLVKDGILPKCDSLTRRNKGSDRQCHTGGDPSREKTPASNAKTSSAEPHAEGTEPPATSTAKNRYRVAVIETVIIAIVVTICIASLCGAMYLFAIRPPEDMRNSTFKGEKPEEAWRKYDEQQQILHGNLCQNFPALYKRFIRFIKRPYQVIGSPCDNYYGLVCSGICHLVPLGLCFWEAARRFVSSCYDLKPDVNTLELWMDFDAFSRQVNIPKTYPSSCRREIEKKYQQEFAIIHGGNMTIKNLLLDRVLFYITYLNSRPACVEERLMMYETFCMVHCCHKPNGDISVEIGRILCQATVGWRGDFTTYFRCEQNRPLIEACWKGDLEPKKCRPR